MALSSKRLARSTDGSKIQPVSSRSAASVLPSLPPPYVYEAMYSSYQKQWQERKKRFDLHVVVLDMEWLASEDDELDYLLACTSTGHVVLWKVSRTSHEEQQQMAQVLLNNEAKPFKKVHISNRPLTTINIVNADDKDNTKDAPIVITGEDGITLVQLRDILNSCAAESFKPVEWWKSIGPIVQASVYEACFYGLSPSGDAYKLNIESQQCVATYKNPRMPHGGKIKSSLALGFVPSSSTTTNSPLLLVSGVVDDTILVWDVAKDQGMDSVVLDISDKSVGQKTKRTGFYGTTANRPIQPRNINSICAMGNWWTVAGGQQMHQPLEGGFLSTLHGPTRSMVACAQTRECIQHVAALAALTSSRTAQDTRLATVANEGVVSFWDSSYSLQRTHRVWSSPPSGRSMAISSNKRSNDCTLAVGGVGSSIDLLENFCRTQTLTLL